MRLRGNELTVNAISERRIDSVLDTICEIDPAAVVRTEARQPIADTRAAQRLANQRAPKESPFFKPGNAPPEVQQAVAAYIQNYEQEWLHLPVPALSGLTPRQAADDPTRKDDLVRLLASFGDADGPTDMSAHRLRAMLGLEHT